MLIPLSSIKEKTDIRLSQKIKLAKILNPHVVNRLETIQAEMKTVAPLEHAWESMFSKDAWEIQLNALAREEAEKHLYKIKFQIYLIESDKNEWRLLDGTTVIVQYHGTLRNILDKKWWHTLRNDIFPACRKLQRSSALEKRNILWKLKLDNTPQWKKFKNASGVWDTFKLLPPAQFTKEELIRVTLKHKGTNITVSLEGVESEREYLETHARIMLSRQVAEYQSQELKELYGTDTTGTGNSTQSIRERTAGNVCEECATS